jgi:methylase of polypeptide subunit release factors
MTSYLQWEDGDSLQQARWQCANGMPQPKQVWVADDTLNADQAYRMVCEGTGLLWRGDFHNAKQLLQALARRVDKTSQNKTAQKTKPPKNKTNPDSEPAATTKATAKANPIDPRALVFHQHRQKQAQRARVLSLLLIEIQADGVIPLRRAPDVRLPLTEAFGKLNESIVMPLRELQGLIGAHEWRKKGVLVPALQASIHPYYGVFSPVRGEYVDLVAQAPLPVALSQYPALDVGTGTGVLAAVLARRSVAHIIATEQSEVALTCARANLKNLGCTKQVKVVAADLFPDTAEQYALVVCNPPWIPAKVNAPIEAAIYDPDSRMLRQFLQGVRSRLAPGGEAWLILSDIAEHLGLRTREALLSWISEAGLKVHAKHDIRPRHAKVQDTSDPLHAARAAEVTSLWRFVLS